MAEQPPVRVAGWEVKDHKGWCSAFTAFDPDVVMVLGYDVAQDTALFSLYSPRWRSIAKDANYPLRIDFSTQRYYSTSEAEGEILGEAGAQQFGVGTAWKGEEYLGDFAAASWMEIKVRGTLLGRFSLKGTREMVRALARCSERSFREYPGDPFEGAAPTGASSSAEDRSAATSSARLTGGSISNDDYPAAAERAGAEGDTRITLQVGANGRPTGCSVTGSSGNSALDSTACTLATRRFRFTPATRGGQPVAGSYSTTIRWRLPDAIPVPAPIEVPAPSIPAGAPAPGQAPTVESPHPYQPVRQRASNPGGN
jgi:TonB family protein